jgi:phosphodiesterase/alkaline phosphatase D-like protein
MRIAGGETPLAADRWGTMAEISRRTFLTRSAMAAGAAAVATTALPQAARASAPAATEPDETTDTLADAVVAYVRPGSGEVTVMVGEREVVARDRDLARRIRRAAR